MRQHAAIDEITIWAHEVDIFRTWRLVDAQAFRAIQSTHWRKLPYWVFLPVGLTLVGSLALPWIHPAGVPPCALWGNAACQLLSLLLTAFMWGPWQAALSRDPLGPASPHLSRILRTHWVRTLLITAGGCFLLAALDAVAEPAPGPSIAGIDHMPTAVRSLDQASESYRRLGFTLKPGRSHPDGLQNNHVKFEDGSGIELISPPAVKTDDLTARYIDFLRNGDGPAYLGLHVRDARELRQALEASGLSVKPDSAGVALDEPLLDFLFIDQDNRSPTDRPEHFTHPNSAFAMTGVWLALDDSRLERLRRLLLALGATEGKERVLAPTLVEASVFTVQNGRIVVIPASHQLRAGRPIVGAEFRVHDIARTACARRARQAASARSVSSRSCAVPPTEAHGLWLEFHD